MDKTPSIFNHTLQELTDALDRLGYPSFRARQIYKWLYQRGVYSYEDMSDLSRDMRSRLQEELSVALPAVVTEQHDELDGTDKWLLEFGDEERVECVRMTRFRDHVETNPSTGAVRAGNERDIEGHTICLSTQVGCQYGCRFCASGQSGLKRNLTAGEIISQVAAFQAKGMPINRVVFMGSGEPLHNLDEVRRTILILTEKEGYALSPRRLTVSTVGMVPEIYRMAMENWSVKLAISLHATTDENRVKLIPLARGYNLDQLMDALRFYQRGQGRRISFEYLMLDGINDTKKDADRLVRMTRGLTCHVNLIPFNRVSNTPFAPSPPRRVQEFRGWLRKQNIDATVRYSRGRGIDAACGQLRLRYEDVAVA